MEPTVVYVHGNGNKVREDRLKTQWDQALFGRDMGARSVMAYWASVRYEQPLPDTDFDEIEARPAPNGDDPQPDRESATADGVQPVDLRAEVLMEARREIGGAEGMSDEHTDLDPWLERMAFQADAIVAGEDAQSPGADASPLPRSVRVAIFRAMVKVTFKDVYAYFFGGLAEPMRGVLRQAIARTQGPLVVVGHSLGTIIAYDVLREEAMRGRDVRLFVTAGSPLAVQEVQDLVVRPLKVPIGVVAWRNVADGRDLVALDPTIRPEYDPESRCSDFMVVNDSNNHHGIRQYLATPAVRNAVTPLFLH